MRADMPIIEFQINKNCCNNGQLRQKKEHKWAPMGHNC